MSLEVAVCHRLGAFTLDAAFTVDEPGVTALFGPSGAGKSTLVQAVAGLIRPDKGRIVLDGEVVFDAGSGRHLPARRRRIGYVFQEGRLFPHRSVADNLRFGARRAGGRPATVGFDETVELLGIDHLLGRRPRALSGGERQRVALGRALLSSPRLLLLDEPLAALDQARKAEILPFLARLRDEARVPMVYVTHALDEITQLADTLVLLNEGRVVATAPVLDAMARLDLLPFTGEAEAGAVIACTVERHDTADALTALAFPGGTIWVSALPAPIGARLRVRIRARDVLLAVTADVSTSANTVLEGRVEAIRDEGRGVVDLQLRVGAALIVARLTRRSLARLGLVVGARATALVKAVSIEARAYSS